MQTQKIHFIAVGGAVMHNLALALKKEGNIISGSDDEIFEPAKSRLEAAGILPENEGWFPEKITNEIDIVILGMHARADNSELAAAQNMGVKIFSFPEYIYHHSQNKKRIVIGGSHGKTTSTAMLMHVLKETGHYFDYLVGSQIEGFDLMVKLTETAPIVVIEGDEYLTSTLDLRPKFHLYHPQIAMLTGIAWDHINVFPTFEIYLLQFEIFVKNLPDGAPLAYFFHDEHIRKIVAPHHSRLRLLAYDTHRHIVENNYTILYTDKNGKVPVHIFGEHNLQNLSGVKMLCNELEISGNDFYNAISTFKGTARRMENIYNENSFSVFKDFAHSPSKLKATVNAVKNQFANRKLIAVYELHTFSSLNADFLQQYKNCMDETDEKIIFMHDHTFELKKMKMFSENEIKNVFGEDTKIISKAQDLENYILNISKQNSNLLLMSSGNFGGAVFKF